MSNNELIELLYHLVDEEHKRIEQAQALTKEGGKSISQISEEFKHLGKAEAYLTIVKILQQ